MLTYLHGKVGFILNLLLYEKFTKHAILRAVLLGVMGVATFFFPEFLLSGMVYVIAGYVILNSALSVVNYFIREKASKASINYLNLIIGCLLIIFGILTIIYFRRLVSILPVFLGVLMMIEGAAYFVIAMCASKIKRRILIALAVFILIGGGVVVLTTFGSLMTLSQVFGVFLLLSCVYELVAYLIHGKAVK